MINVHTDPEKAGLKKRLLDKCVQLIEARIASAAEAIANAQAAANAEEKSSAGDKYETSRAMSHLEKDMHSRQLAVNREELAALLSINFSRKYSSVAAGSFVSCAHCSFFIAAGLGKMTFEGEDVYVISPVAPLAKLLLKKEAGDIIKFNKTDLVINSIF
ncbi:MAG: hypothetical protein ABIQ31_25490 [Ferruginibacter sp.]